MVLQAALGGFGVACVLEDEAAPHLASGDLRQVMTEWTQPFAGYYLYYPSRRQQSAAFALLLEELRQSAASRALFIGGAHAKLYSAPMRYCHPGSLALISPISVSIVDPGSRKKSGASADRRLVTAVTSPPLSRTIASAEVGCQR
jgi:hypothetical protein